MGLRSHDLLKKTKIRTKKKNGWTTTIYLMLEIRENFLGCEKVLGTSKHPFFIKTIDHSEYSIGSFRNI